MQCCDISHTVCTAGQQVSRALSELHSCCEKALLDPLTDRGLRETDIKYAYGLCASKHTQRDMQTLCSPVQCMMVMLRREFGREEVYMCIYFHSSFLWDDNNGKRESYSCLLQPLHNDIIIDFHQQYNPVQACIHHQARQLSKHTEAIVEIKR